MSLVSASPYRSFDLLGNLFYSSEAVQCSFPRVHPLKDGYFTSCQNNKPTHPQGACCIPLLTFSLQSDFWNHKQKL